MRRRIGILAFSVALCTAVVAGSASAYFAGGWPETCLEMNDMVEGSPRGSGAIGIYQRAFGDQAEHACRNDHRDDVRRAFAWAFDKQPTGNPAPAPIPPPVQATITESSWDYSVNERIPVNRWYWAEAFTNDAVVAVRCHVSDFRSLRRELNVYVGFLHAAEGELVGNAHDRLEVTYRIDEQPEVTTSWLVAEEGHSVFAPEGQVVDMARKLKTTTTFRLRTVSKDGKAYDAAFKFIGGGDSISKVLAKCGH